MKYQYKPHTTQAVDPNIDKDVSYAMQQVVQHGTGTNAQALGRPAAGKTGTATSTTSTRSRPRGSSASPRRCPLR